jgi:hypothetical protein
MTPARSILRGELDKVGLPTLLTILDMEKRGGILILQKGKQLGRLFLRDGRVIRAQIEGQQRQCGADAVMKLFAWNGGVFELWQADVIGPDEIQRSTTYLLMEAARRLDEARAAEKLAEKTAASGESSLYSASARSL